MIKEAMGGYVVTAESGKKLSKKLPTKAAAKKRLAQVEMFKHMKEASGGPRTERMAGNTRENTARRSRISASAGRRPKGT